MVILLCSLLFGCLLLALDLCCFSSVSSCFSISPLSPVLMNACSSEVTPQRVTFYSSNSVSLGCGRLGSQGSKPVQGRGRDEDSIGQERSSCDSHNASPNLRDICSWDDPSVLPQDGAKGQGHRTFTWTRLGRSVTWMGCSLWLGRAPNQAGS
jgi:hypothetical protein